MHRLVVVITFVVCVAAIDTPADAGWYEFWHRANLDWKRNNAWPEPFVRADRRAYFRPFNTMVTKGWLRQNTIGNHHFHPETNRLTEAGELKLRWVVTQTPPEHRTVVVLRGRTKEATAIRTDSVQQAASRMVPEGELPEVRVTDIEARAWSADEVDAIGRKARESLPAPVLPDLSGSSSSP